MNRQTIYELQYELSNFKDELYLMEKLSDYMHKDPIYQNRCNPDFPKEPTVETDWNMVHMKIVELKESIKKIEELLK
jgi:hypothetical protein